MKRSELLTRILITAAVIGAVGTPLYFWARTPLVHARVAGNGGWSPNVIQAKVNVPLHLRLTSDDVMHGFAVGQMDMQSVDVSPGKVTDLTLTFNKPGTYIFYCTRWCGLDHWRMRGAIEVGGSNADSATVSTPMYVALGLNIDVSHDAPIIPDDKPSAISGAQLAAHLPISQFTTPDFYQTDSPYQLFEDLNSTHLSDSEKWDVVSYVWQSNTTPESLLDGKKLFVQNCAACHGENGAGDGAFADKLSTGVDNNSMLQMPADFTDPRRMLGAVPALLQGKILRGGMGTGMPSWGPIFTDSQTWDLVAYIYSFQFQYH